MPLVGIGSLPTPFSPASVPLPPETGGRGHTSLRVGGWGESQFRRGAYTVVLFICTYFVIFSHCLSRPISTPPYHYVCFKKSSTTLAYSGCSSYFCLLPYHGVSASSKILYVYRYWFKKTFHFFIPRLCGLEPDRGPSVPSCRVFRPSVPVCILKISSTISI
jgi:hypothetical protein